MKHPNHFGRWLACVLLCLLLAGCSMPGEQVQVEELLRAPKLSGDYGDVQTALNDWLGESAQLKYPMQGDLLSPFLLQDLDGDGRQDAAVLYTTAQSSNVCIAILQKDDADIWHVRQNVEGLADTVESVAVSYTHLDVYKRQHFHNSTKNSNLFSSKMPLDMLYGGGVNLKSRRCLWG